MQIATKAARAYNSKKPMCLVAGGETTVTLTGSGKGGRSQEMVLSAGIQLQKGFKVFKDRKRNAEVFFLSAGKENRWSQRCRLYFVVGAKRRAWDRLVIFFFFFLCFLIPLLCLVYNIIPLLYLVCHIIPLLYLLWDIILLLYLAYSIIPLLYLLRDIIPVLYLVFHSYTSRIQPCHPAIT